MVYKDGKLLRSFSLDDKWVWVGLLGCGFVKDLKIFRFLKAHTQICLESSRTGTSLQLSNIE